MGQPCQPCHKVCPGRVTLRGPTHQLAYHITVQHGNSGQHQITITWAAQRTGGGGGVGVVTHSLTEQQQIEAGKCCNAALVKSMFG